MLSLIIISIRIIYSATWPLTLGKVDYYIWYSNWPAGGKNSTNIIVQFFYNKLFDNYYVFIKLPNIM